MTTDKLPILGGPLDGLTAHESEGTIRFLEDNGNQVRIHDIPVPGSYPYILNRGVNWVWHQSLAQMQEE